jgi:hypothetical protein
MEDHQVTTAVGVGYEALTSVRRLSKANDISVSEWIRRAIREKLEREAPADLQSDTRSITS